MSDMFESLDLNMREEAERVNPTKAIMASQMECEQRFESFVAKNPERVDFLSDDIRSVADRYAAQYDISSDTIYDATVTHLKEAAIKQAESEKPWEKEEKEEDAKEEGESEEHEEHESEEEEEEEHEKESSLKDARFASYVLANEEVLFPEWMRRDAAWQDWKNAIKGLLTEGLPTRPLKTPDWDSSSKPLPKRRRRVGPAADEQPTTEIPVDKLPAGMTPEESQQEFANERMRKNLEYAEQQRLKEEFGNMETPAMKARGPYKGEYLRGASTNSRVANTLVDLYTSYGVPEKTASILVQSVGEMAQLQQNAPGLPVEAEDPNSVNPDTAIGGQEGDKYKNWNVEQKQKELGLEHQDFTDFGEPVREFVQPGGEAPYAENTNKRIDDAKQDNMNAKNVKQDDNAPKKSSVKSSNMSVEEIKARIKEIEGYTKRDLSAGEAFGPDHGQDDAAYDELHDLKQLLKEKTESSEKKSSASVKEADNNRAAIDELIEYARRGMRALREAAKIDAQDGFSWDNGKWNQEEENLKQEILLLAEEIVDQPLSSLRDLNHYLPGAYSEIEAFLSNSIGHQISPEEMNQMAEEEPDEFVDRFASMDSTEAQVEKLMAEGMTPEQAVQSVGVYNEERPKGWGGSKNF